MTTPSKANSTATATIGAKIYLKHAYSGLKSTPKAFQKLKKTFYEYRNNGFGKENRCQNKPGN